MLKFLDSVTRIMDKSAAVDVVYLDIAKAFDTIPHDKLLDQLVTLGIHEKLFYWIRGFLKDRSQFVAIGDSRSDCTRVTSGVPQGSVLGPLLFLVYFETVNLINGNLLKFADDSKVFGSENQQLQHNLDFLVQLMHDKGLKVAANKSCVMTISASPVVVLPDYSIGGQIIPRVTCEKDIGIYVDQRLKFSEHCQKIANRANSLCFRVMSSFVTRDSGFLFTIFKSYIRPLLESDSSAWSPYLKADILRVEGPQRRFTKRLEGLENLSYLARLNALNEETLLVRRVKSDLTLVYKIAHGLVDGLDNLLQFAQNIRTRGHSYKVVLEPFRLNARKNFFSVRVSNIWNALPSAIAESGSLYTFKSQLRRLNLNQLNDTFFD